MTPTVLMVAEKPSLASSIANLLSGNQVQSRRGAQEVHEFSGTFQGRPAHFKMTSVIGHVYNLDFTAQYQNWDTTDCASLFDATTVKVESNPKAHICEHLQREARGADFLVLWLDCDREGENICFEVLQNTTKWMQRAQGRLQQVYRARFSAVSAPEVAHAMETLKSPNHNEALAVDARAELDLKMGVAFTRFQTRYFQGKYGNLDSSVISYGPCQTPTLRFCVARQQQIAAFKPQPFWTVHAHFALGGMHVALTWERGRIFERAAAAMFYEMVARGGRGTVQQVAVREERKARPAGLNTVELLKVASAALGIGPHQAMQLAERLYTQGYLSYPRTESTAYPPNFDFHEVLAGQRRHPLWGGHAVELLQEGFARPRSGTDMGDHPPITPVAGATEAELGGGNTWRIYEYVARHFLASLKGDCMLKRTSVVVTAGDQGREVFTATGREVLDPGWTAVMPWRAVEGEELPEVREGMELELAGVELHEGQTSPPDYLTESELIGLMEKHGIGTDASIPTHINNITERNYVQVGHGRKVVPTALGITLIRGYERIDADLCLPIVRGHVERQLDQIARGEADYSTVVAHTLHQLAQKFAFFAQHIERMDELFESSFSALKDTGKPMSKCGVCSRYMKYIQAAPQRLYCQTCEAVYALPQRGVVKLYKELTCPLDNFELVIYTSAGTTADEGISYPLCPCCYNDPPFPGVEPVYGGIGAAAAGGASATGGMPCTVCTHETCPHSMTNRRVCDCPECDTGSLVLDPLSAPKWRLNCNRCSCRITLPEGAHRIATTSKQCAECTTTLLQVDFSKNNTPLEGGATKRVGCIMCDELLYSLIQVVHAKTSFRGRGRGRRGKGGRGRGRKPKGDPKMSYRDF